MRIHDILVENSLASLVAKDQQERQEYMSFVKSKVNGDYNKGAQLYAKLKNRSKDDIFGEKKRLRQFTKMKFDFNTFSDNDWEHYWTLAQHSDFDRQFQKRALKIISRHRCKDSQEYKYLYDRISCGLNGTQKYDTQDSCNAK